MRHGARRLTALLTALVLVSSLAAASASAAGVLREVDVAVTPPEDITFGQLPEDPSAEQVDRGSGTDQDGAFTYRYVGVDGTDYDSERKPLGAGKYQVIATLNSATHSGEGVSAPFTIQKTAKGTVRRTVAVPTSGGSRTVYISELGLYAGMLKGAEIKEKPKFTDGEVLKSGSLTADGAAFTLEIKPAADGKSQNFRFVLTSDNYEELAVTVAVTSSTDADDLEITGLKVGEPNTFPYGTVLKDIIDLKDCAAVLNGQSVSGTFALAEPEKRYSVGESTGVALRFTCDGREYTRTVPAGFTITPVDAAFVGWDEAFIRDGYWITTYANSPYNTSVESLRDLVQDRKQNFTISSGHRRFSLYADWSADGSSLSFDLQGQKPHQAGDIIWYDWYAYTAALTSPKVNVKNMSAGSVQPKAYIRVVPVTAAADLGSDSKKTVSAADIAALTEESWRTALTLPESATVHYEPVEQPQWSDVYIPEPDTAFVITGWQMEGENLTLAALKAKAAEAVDGDVELTLTPVYDGIPAWATVLPAVELTIIANERSGQNEA